MDPDAYLKKHHLLTYVDDAIRLLLARRDEDSKTKPFQLLAGYFRSVLDGSHVVFREYSFISATPRNRRSFVGLVWQTYSGVPEAREPMRLVELHSLLRLLCADFPLRETEKVATALHGYSTASSIVSFTDFMYTFQITFYFDGFLGHLKSLLPGVLMGAYVPPLYPQLTAVVVPLPPPTTAASPNSPSKSLQDSVRCDSSEARACSKAVNGGIFLEAVLGLGRRMGEREPGQSCPSQEALIEVLGGVEKLSLNEFVVKLSLSEMVNREIGVLPCRT